MPSTTVGEPSFEHLSVRAQVHRLRQVAVRALADYPVEPRSVRLLEHGYNTTFRVDTTDGERFALRINVSGYKTEANLDAEVAWLAALADQTDLTVPVPQRTRDGRARTTVRFDALARDLPAVLMSWLPGRNLGGGSPEGFRALGGAAARLHEHAARWSLPAGADFPSLDGVLVDAPAHVLDDHPLVRPSRRAVFAAALDHVQAHYDDIAAAEPARCLHADLHGGNAKWLRGRIAVFDFDDACTGAEVHDLAIAAYYIRPEAAHERALLEGYAEVRPLPTFTDDQYEAVVAGRNLVLANDVLTIANAEVRAAAPTYLANAELKLRAYLDTGVFRHDVPGVVPIAF